MSAEHTFPEKKELTSTPTEFAGRVALASGVAAVVFAIWMANLPSAANWTGLYARVAPRVCVFVLGIFVALAVQGRRVKTLTLALSGTLALLGMFALQGWAGLFEIFKLQPDAVPLVAGGKTQDWSAAGGNVFFHARRDMLGPGAALLLMRFECALFAAVLIGTCIGRGVKLGWHFLTLLLFAAICDAWLNVVRAPESVDANLPFAALRLPFVPAVGRLSVAPAFTDILFVSAALEASRLFPMHTFWAALGAVTGYCSGSFFGQEPLFSMGLAAAGMIVAAWPYLKIDSTGLGKTFFSIALLIMTLIGLVALRHKLNPPAPQRNIREPEQMRSVAAGDVAPRWGGSKR